MLSCKVCKTVNPDDFSMSSAHRRLCRHHFNQKKRAQRGSSMEHAIMARIQSRRQGSKFRIADARAVLQAFDHRSVWCGSDSDLTIVRRDKSMPLTRTNAMVITVRQANLRRPEDVIARAAAIAESLAEVLL